jgi:hypothetical protein
MGALQHPRISLVTADYISFVAPRQTLFTAKIRLCNPPAWLLLPRHPKVATLAPVPLQNYALPRHGAKTKMLCRICSRALP